VTVIFGHVNRSSYLLIYLSSFGARSFSVALAAPQIWHSLPSVLRVCTSTATFRRHLKTRYFQQVFQSA